MSDGTIDLGRFGRVQVAGMTPEQVEGAVTALVQQKEKETGPVLVRVVAQASQVFYVLGEVNAPGAFPLTGRAETVLDGILMAGGLNERASRADIILARPTPPCEPRVVLPVCYSRIVQLGDTATNYQPSARRSHFCPVAKLLRRPARLPPFRRPLHRWQEGSLSNRTHSESGADLPGGELTARGELAQPFGGDLFSGVDGQDAIFQLAGQRSHLVVG